MCVVEGRMGGLFAQHNISFLLSYFVCDVWCGSHTVNVIFWVLFHWFSDPYCYLKCVKVVSTSKQNIYFISSITTPLYPAYLQNCIPVHGGNYTMTISYSALNYGINGSLLPIRCLGTLWPLTLCVSHLERTKHQITHSSQKPFKVTPGVPMLLLNCVLHILFLSEETLFFGLVLFYYLFNDWIMKD